MKQSEVSALFMWSRIAVGKYPELNQMQWIPARGVPNICIPAPKGKYKALHISLCQKPTSSRLILEMRAAGNCIRVCDNWEMAKMAIENYLDPQRAVGCESRD